jgi:MFS family permease
MIKTSAQEAYHKFAAEMTDKELDAFRVQQMLAGTLGIGGTGAGAGYGIGKLLGRPGLGALIGGGAGSLLGAGTGALSATTPFTKQINVDEGLKRSLESPVASGIGQGVGMGLAGGGLLSQLPRAMDWTNRGGLGRAIGGGAALGAGMSAGPLLGGVLGEAVGERIGRNID